MISRVRPVVVCYGDLKRRAHTQLPFPTRNGWQFEVGQTVGEGLGIACQHAQGIAWTLPCHRLADEGTHETWHASSPAGGQIINVVGQYERAWRMAQCAVLSHHRAGPAYLRRCGDDPLEPLIGEWLRVKDPTL